MTGSKAKHGSARRYALGCTCDPCTDNNTERNNTSRQRRLGREPSEHGASAYRNWGCTCTVCVQGHTALMASKRNAAGRGRNYRQPWTSADLDLALEMKDSRRYAHTALEVARELGRSVSAVNQQRTLAKARVKSEREPSAP
jgi:hypothetical protein